ncbi:unnamed protein product [Mesocestoides corti]|uniref:Uncharacterized protein n=1 Tax=Mesocestoides corti TaxID=53468 RepID=A0A0R3U1H5_MESCO|nr:unnamed protein product [Mesocestoides corti]
MIDAEILPELALRCNAWELFLGMPIQQAFEIFKKCDAYISNIDFWYSEISPFKFNMLLHLPNDGMKLHFDPKWQRLMVGFTISCLFSICSGSLCNYMRTHVLIFSLNFPLLVPDDKPGTFRLCYRGITFIFSSDSEFNLDEKDSTVAVLPPTGAPSSITDASVANSEEQLIVKRIYVFLGQNVTEAKVPLQLPAGCFHGNVFLERLLVSRSKDRTDKLCFDLVYQGKCQKASVSWPINCSGFSRHFRSVRLVERPAVRRYSSSVAFGDSVQDVLSALGSPSRIFYKTEDKMKIHLPQPYRQSRQKHSNFFYNYFSLGVDVLFDARTKRAISFVLHTNQPGEYTFNTYYRCMFEIPLTGRSDDGEPKSVVVTPFVKVQSLLRGVIDDEPVVIHRETKSRKNPFGVTNAYCYHDLIFEVLPQNGYLTSVTIYSLPDSSGAH